MEKNLRYFMREEKEEVVTVPAPDNFVDEKGNRLEMQVKTLPRARIDAIFESYRKREIALDKKGNPYTQGGNVLCKINNDTDKAFRHIIAEALVSPNLADPELMEFYKCYDKVEMVRKVFSKREEYDQVWTSVMTVLGLIQGEDEVEEAKN